MTTFTEVYAGSDTFTTTEESIANNTSATTAQSITDDGVYQLFLDCNALADGDEFQVAFKEKARSGDTQRPFWTIVVANDQGADENVVFPPVTLLHGWDITIKKLAGTDRAIAWSIRKLT